MSSAILLIGVLLLCGFLSIAGEKRVYEAAECYRTRTANNFFFNYKHESLDGTSISFERYKDKVSLVVNVASFWALTNATYIELNALISKYGEGSTNDNDGKRTEKCSFQVLGFPSNQFGHQEPGKNHEIINCLKYVRPGLNFVPKFKIFSKCEVNGAGAIGLFKWLKYMCPRPTNILSSGNHFLWKPIEITDIRWNFEEFLLNHRGEPVRRYSADTLPLTFEKDIVAAIDKCKKEIYKV